VKKLAQCIESLLTKNLHSKISRFMDFFQKSLNNAALWFIQEYATIIILTIHFELLYNIMAYLPSQHIAIHLGPSAQLR